MKRGTIVLTPFPFTDLKTIKRRPALIVSNNPFNKKSDDYIMVPLTTVIKDEPYSILINQEGLSSGKLLKPSRIRIDKFFSVQKNLIIMKIGKLNDKIFNKVKLEISKLF